MQQAPMGNNMHDAFWHNNQVIVTFHSDMQVSEFTKDSAIEFLNKHTESLNAVLKETSLTLSLLNEGDVQHSTREAPRGASDAERVDGSSGPGIYLFQWSRKILPSIPTTQAGAEILTGLVGFFHIHDVRATQHDMTDTMLSSAEMPHRANTDKEQEGANMGKPGKVIGPVASIVNLLNAYALNNVNAPKKVPILAAEPHYYCGATGDIPQGCPVSPPMPVPAGVSCPSSLGLFPLEFSPGLQPDTIGTSGKEVTICILDTLPKREQITQAAQAAGENNKLLLDVEKSVKFCYDYDHLVDAVDKSGRLAVGKDIYGRHGHFRLSDHGLFIAGIVRSLASEASIECIRVLNDFCVGDMRVLLQSLQDIHNRMLHGGDLQDKRVVISMSVVIPTNEEAMQMGIELNAESHNMIRTSTGTRK